MKNFWNFFLLKRNFSYIILITLVIFGIQSLLTIPKESAPEVQVPIAIVTTIYPGASALDVERLITNKVEEQLNGSLENVSRINSTSSDGLSSVIVEFNTDVDLDKSIQDVKSEIDKIKSELPSDVEDVLVSNLNFTDQPIMTVTLISELPENELIQLVKDLESEIKSIQGVSEIQTSGISDKEAQIILNREALTQYNISILDVVNAIRSANTSLPVGSIETDNIEYSVVFKGAIEDVSELNNISILNSSGTPIYIRDIAFVNEGISEKNTYSRLSINKNISENSISLSVFKSSGGDITVISDNIREKLISLEDSLLYNIPYLIAFDSGEFVKKDLISLSLSALQTIGLVILILLIALGWRESLIAGLAIPLSFLVAFIALKETGNTINFISLFSLILAVGILVDSAIVMTEAIHINIKRGLDKVSAAKKAISDFYWPLMSGTATTIAVFAPLFIISGVTGDFIASIPFTIIFVLAASLFVALGIIPLVASLFLKKKNRTKFEEKQEFYSEKVENKYKDLINKIIGNKKLEKKFFKILAVTFIIAILLPFTGLLKVVFFPQEDVDYLFVDIETAEGSVLGKTDLAVRQVEEFLYQVDEIDSFIIDVGAASAFGGDGGSRNSKLASITIILDEDRKRTSTEILNDLREDFSQIVDAEVRVYEPNNGPPGSDPVYIKVFNQDLNKLKESVDKIEIALATVEGATEINSSSRSDSLQFELILDRERASQFGLTASQIALFLRTSVFGTTATTIKNIDGDIDVVLRLNFSYSGDSSQNSINQINIEDIKNLTIPTANGPVFLSSVLSDELGFSNTSISHENLKRVGFVSSSVSNKTPTQVISDFRKIVDSLDLPEDTEIVYGGETEDIQRTFKEMGFALILGVILILGILVLQFNSFRHAFYIISVLPLALIGVFFGLTITGRAISFPSIMGFIALSGIVVNNSIILVDVMNSLRKKFPEKSIKEVVIEGATSRLRPILLTTLTTIFGVLPLVYSSSLWSPLALSIIFGLAFSVVITLILIPILYNRKPGIIEGNETNKEKEF